MSYQCYFLSVPNIRDKKGNEKKVVDVITGNDVRLTCQVKEPNGVKISWLKNDKTFSPLDHPRMRLKLNKQDLRIKRVQKDDTGFYTCGIRIIRILNGFLIEDKFAGLLFESQKVGTLFCTVFSD